MKKLPLLLCLATSTALGQNSGSVSIRNTAGTAQADVRATTPLAGTNAVTVILHPNSASIGTSPASKNTTPFSAVNLNGTATSSADTGVSAYTSISLAVTYSAGVTGSPATCTLQIQYSADATHFVNWGTALSLSPASSTTQSFEAPSNVPGPMGQSVQYVYACGTYPTGGTFTVTSVYTTSPMVSNGVQVQSPTAANFLATVTGSVQQTGNGTVFNGQASFTTAAAFATNSAREVWVRALASNTDILWVGSSSVTTGNGFPLYPGDAIGPLHVTNSNLIYGVANTGTQSAAFNGTN